MGPPQALRGTGARRAPGDAAAARTALSDFGADFLRRARALDPSAANAAISPYSLFAVLAMARAGAKAETAAQIDAALRATGIDAQGAVISAVDDGVTAALDAAGKSGGKNAEPTVIQAANQAWVQDGLPVRPEYLDALAVQYGIDAMAAGFAADPEKMRLAINSWVAGRTNHLIPELFPDGSIDPSTVLVLVNALYLKAPWASRFRTGRPAAFFTGTGEVQAPMMTGPKPVRGAIGNGWTSATIPYLGGGAAMTLLVPDKGGFAATVKSLDAAVIHRAAAATTSVNLTMPLFSIRTTSDAKGIAEQLGMTDIFAPGVADLSGIAGRPGHLYAQTFVHQTVVNVDEQGTEAAAATGMAIARMSLPMVDLQLTVDRPFLFWISETRTGAPLFLGAVTDPTAST